MEKQEQNMRSWDDLIFENRNKSYGAYALRQDYSTGLIKGVFTSIGIAVALLIVAGFGNTSPIIQDLPTLDGGFEFKKEPKILADVVPAKRTEPARRSNPVFPPIATTDPDPVEPDPQPAVTSTGTEGSVDGTATDTGTTGVDSSTGIDLGTVTVKSNEPFRHVEKMPAYKGGLEGMIRTLQRNMKYPASARRMGKEGTVFVEFVVNDEGEVVDAKVIKGFDVDCDKQAVRMIEKLTEWTPGYQNNMAVNVKLVLPIKFELEE